MLNACHPPSPLLFSVPLLSIRLTRLWTILCPVSMVLGQPALRAARKVMFTFVRCSCCFNLYNSQLHLSPPLSLALLVLVHSASRATVVLDGENSRGRGEFQCIQLSHWVDGCFGGAGLTVFSCGKHKHTVGHSVLVVQTHTNRLSHFSFSLPANFLHLLFSFLLTFCTCFFFLPANFLHLLFFSFLLTFCTCFFFSFLLTFCTCFFFLPANFLHLLFFSFLLLP